MKTYTESFPIQFTPKADERTVVLGPNVRFSVLTSRLLRLEYSPLSRFEDRPSQAFWYRQQPVPEFEVRRHDELLEIETDDLLLQYDPSRSGFSARSLTILLKETGVSWHYGEKDLFNLRGTVRTLDDIDGPIALEEGLISRSGWSVWDDSSQLLFTPEGWLTPRSGEEGYLDLYFFGYGQDYYGCLNDFCKIAGPAPMLPRWALGNWWSRYWAYSADELLALMDEFASREVPLSVCIVDMDWHIVDTGNASSGWTGYTWNRDLFPNPVAFIAALHERGLKTALNLHPAEGIHGHEQQYVEMAEAMGVDAKTEAPIPFAIDDLQFTKAYFEKLHHPYEEQGIDFWWLDWQQGTMSGLPGLDPLWWLNHLHFYDLARNGNRMPFIFSRWGGLGNHRYPIGFSGDTHVTWDSLAFQPYFTATAANVNYGWWSHDIGGHMAGIEDAELYVRWIQFGVFSPILRLHSTNNPYHERRPWGYDAETERAATNALRIRHALIPYLQSMAWRNHKHNVPLTRPMYYDHPQDEQAYHCRDQYLFGSELIAAPFISPADPDSRLSRQVVWLPPGDWFDFFNGDRICGDSWHAVYGRLDDIPVFAKAGAIVPMEDQAVQSSNGSQNSFNLRLFPGNRGSFEMYDADGSASGNVTSITQEWHGQEWFVQIEPAPVREGSLPIERGFEISFRGIHPQALITAAIDDQVLIIDHKYDSHTKTMILAPIKVKSGAKATITLTTEQDSLLAADDRLLRYGLKMLQAFRLNSNIKLNLASQLPQIVEDPAQLAAYQLTLSGSQLRALAEHITGSGAHHRIEVYDGQGEELILWNNQAEAKVSLSFAAEKSSGLAYSDNGPVPRFGVLLIKEKGLTYHSGNQPAQGRISIDGWFDTLVDRIPRDQIRDIEVIIQFDIRGDIRCQMYLEMDRENLSLSEGLSAKPGVTITADSEAWLGLINGDRSPEDMFLSGTMQIGGNFELIAGLVDAFSFAPPGNYLGDRWRLDINYLDALILKLGTE